MHTFTKQERLCSHILINQLLRKGNSFYVYPFRCVWLEIPTNKASLQIAFSVPKKKLKFAHQRNLVRRRIRAIYRLNKASILDELQQNNKHIICLFVYSEQAILPYDVLQEKILVVINRIREQLFVTLDVQKDKKDE
jgi:ribonuclease P protein component